MVVVVVCELKCELFVESNVVRERIRRVGRERFGRGKVCERIG